MLGSLSNNIIAHIFEFLSLKDYAAVALSCRKFYENIADHKTFWTRECLRYYLSFDLEAYSEVYDSQDYKTYIQNKAFTSQRYSYKKLLIDGSVFRNSFAEVLSNFSSQERVNSFMTYFLETMKQPLLPLANLKRETIICNAQTIFQHKLSEVLYEDSGMLVKKLNFPSENEELFNELLNSEEKILKECESLNTNHIVKARWYAILPMAREGEDTYPHKEKNIYFGGLPELSLQLNSLDSTNDDDVQSVKNNAQCLLDLYSCLYNMIVHFCEIVFQYLNSLDNTYYLLAEYTARWNNYVSSMLELEQTFKAFTEMMNKTYEHVCEGYPSFPKFSIWRLMTKIWVQEVYEKSNLKLSLKESFLRILGSQRERNIQEFMNIHSSNIDSSDCEGLPKGLYINLKTKHKKKSTLQYQNASEVENLTPNCIAHLPEVQKRVLSSFMQSVLDISMNEVNIHYLDCTECTVSYPFQEIEEAFALQTNEFYREYVKLFAESSDSFFQFLKKDSSLISAILPQRTQFKLDGLQIQNGFEFNKEFVLKQLEKVTKEDLEKCENQTVILNEHDNTDLFIESFLTELIEEHTRTSPKTCFDFNSLPPLDLEEEEEENIKNIEDNKESIFCQFEDSKLLIKKLVKFLEVKYQNLKENFEYISEKLQAVEKVKENDKYLKEYNTNKNIPFEMGDVDSLFYDLDKNVNLSLLQKLSQEYNACANQDGQDESKEEGLPELNRQELNVPALEDPDFDDLKDIDLLDLGNLSLRRAPI